MTGHPARTLRLYGGLRELAGAREVQVPFARGTVRELIWALRRAHPELADRVVDAGGQWTGQVHVFVNGRSARWLDGLDTVLGPTDEVDLIPPAAGG